MKKKGSKKERKNIRREIKIPKAKKERNYV